MRPQLFSRDLFRDLSQRPQLFSRDLIQQQNHCFQGLLCDLCIVLSSYIFTTITASRILSRVFNFLGAIAAMAYNLRQAEARGSSVSNKKRKYPPSVWDGDDKAVFQFLQDGEIVDSPVEDGEIVDSPDDVEDGEIVDSPDDVECGFWETPEPAAPVKRIVNMPQACRSVNEFEILKELGEGTYGVVYKGRNKKTGEIVALKKLKMDNHTEGFPLMSLREINILRSSDHPSIIDLKEVVEGSSTDCVFLVMEYMDSDLGAVTHTRRRKNRPFIESEVKCLMLQLLQGVKYLHDNLVLHRDLKTSNLLLNSREHLNFY
ncbi:hypothetical protein POM88_022428 [Heracleum sosnowskyi]|uniref:Protein kinase domain-containing protein n=1 Tax=Heracleum sosnowskyi TaxID=360622 RepID=A0AAD8MUU9_9APIA|nr:hypothetical protein POM88_022428 [Heracleum sosnowskyi]